MKSKKKKLLFICFSALIMVGLMIGVFADYSDDRVGTVVGSTPYDLGDKLFDVSNNVNNIDSDYYYIFSFSYNSPILSNNNLMLFNSDIGICYYNDGVFTFYSNDLVMTHFTMNVGDTYYIYCKYNNDFTVQYSSFNSSGTYVSCSVYDVADSYSLDIYDNSQDVWASVVSVVTDATDSVINNDILLIFAAAIPVISFGVGMLIRLYHKS